MLRALRFAIFAACMGVSIQVRADDSIVVANKKPLGNLDVWNLSVTSKTDDLTITGYEINRGCVPMHSLKNTIKLQFGQTIDIGNFRCDPIEVKFTTDRGPQTVSWISNDAGEFQVNTFRDFSTLSMNLPPMWFSIVTSTQEAVRVENITVNRGKCRYAQIVRNDSTVTGILPFGGRIVVNSAECVPIEVSVTTESGTYPVDLSDNAN